MLMRLIDQETLPGVMDDHDRPFRRTMKGQRWPGLWAHVLPLGETMKGVLLWQDGRLIIVDYWDDYDLYASSDDQVCGGYECVLDDSSWQYANMVSHGFTFEVAS